MSLLVFPDRFHLSSLENTAGINPMRGDDGAYRLLCDRVDDGVPAEDKKEEGNGGNPLLL